MQDISVTRDDFYLYDVTMFDYIDNFGALYIKEPQEQHKAFITYGIIFDFETGEQVNMLYSDEQGNIVSPVYSGLPYLINGKLYKIDKDNITEEDIQRAIGIIDTYLKNKELEKEGKIVKFRGRRLY